MPTKDLRNNVDYKLPNLCANCAAQPAETKWLVHQQKMTGSQSRMTMREFKNTYNYDLLDFTVGVCKKCEGELKQEKIIERSIIGIGCTPVLLGGIGLVAALGGTAFTNVPHIVFIVAIAAGIIFFFAADFLVGKETFAKRSPDGKKFTFRNKKYQAAFGKLNPQLVYARPKQPVTDPAPTT